MSSDPTFIDEDTPIERAWKLLSSMKVRHLPVVEHGRLVGMVSDRDLLLWAQRRVDGTPAFPDLCAAEVMTFTVVSRPPDATLAELAKAMVEHRIDSVPITDDQGALLGLVTSSDLLSWLAEGN